MSKFIGEVEAGRFLKQGLLLGASALAMSLAAPAYAQTAPADDQAAPADAPKDKAAPKLPKKDEEPDTPDIIVSGLRASIASAQSIKMNSGQFVDSVTAIDIGKLPDKNVAEALQRISGIQITRNRGEGSGIAIRGLTQVRTEVNGRDSFGASGGRSLGFEDVPSELLAGVDVYKNPSAELIEGGIGGLVNLRTRMPFDQKKGVLVSGTVGLNYYDLVDDSRFNASALASGRFNTGIGEIGILVDLSYFEGAFRSDDISIEPYFNRTNIPGSVGTTRAVPDGAGIGITFGQRIRKGAYAALQWAPASNLELYGQYFRTDYTIETPNYTSFVTCGTDPNCATNGMQPSGPFAFDSNGNFISGSFNNVGALANNTQFTSNRSITSDYSGGFKWGVNDHLKINGDAQYISSSATNRSFTAFPQRDGGASFALDLSGNIPKLSFGPAGTNDPNNYYVIALMDHLEDSVAHEYSGRLDLEWDFDDDSPLKTFTAGVRYTDRSALNRSTPYNWQFLSAPWGGSATAPNGLILTPYAISNPYDSSFFYGKGTGVVGAVPFLNWHYLQNGAQGFSMLSNAAGQSCCGPYPRTLIDYTGNDINTQSEKTYAAYAMLRFDFKNSGFPLDGNIGLRVVKTQNEALGQFRLSYYAGSYTAATTTVDTPRSGSQDYTAFLPSLNLRYHISDRLQLRAAASRGLSRPPFYDLRAIYQISESATYNAGLPNPGGPACSTFTAQTAPNACFSISRTGNGGNPALKPLTTDQADLALEWYPRSTTMLYGTLFYKRVNNFEGTALLNQSFPVPGHSAQTFQLTTLANGGKGTIKGFEVGGNTFFNFLPSPLDGFGVQANLTYVDSAAPSLISFDTTTGAPLQTPLQGLSKWSYNLVGFYEKYGFTLRGAYNWRDDYLDTVTGNGTGTLPIYRRPYGQLDGSLSYDFNKHFSVTFDAVNILRTMKQSYQGTPDRPRDYLQEDRRIGISIRLRN